MGKVYAEVDKKDLIPFNEWSKDRILNNYKHCTSRHKRYSKDIRVQYITPKLPWWLIKNYFWKAEGAYSPNELQEVIETIYKREVSDDEMFYVHFGNFRSSLKATRHKEGR